MANLSAFLMRRVTLAPAVVLVCLGTSAVAQHGGGGGGHGGGFGGHFGGGHFGGHGHSSHASHSRSGHSGGHWSWLHFRSHGRNGAGLSPGLASGTPAELSRGLARGHSISSTYIAKLPVSFRRPLAEARFTTTPRFPHHSGFFREGFRRFHSSGCFFNGFSQVCYFEPAWPLYDCFSGFWFPFDFGLGDDGGDASDALASSDLMPPTSPPDVESEGAPSQPGAETESRPAPPLRGLDLDPRFFLLILRNGGEHVVTDYWLADGYIEYVSRDGSQSHIPVDSLDLDQTVRSNSARGLSFVLRSGP